MTTIDQELLDVALEALSKNKVKVDKLSSIADKLVEDLNSHKSVYDTDKEVLSKRLDKFTDAFKKELEDTLKAIPVPKNGKDGSNGIDGIQGPQGEQGKEGKRGADGIQGSKGERGERGISGETGNPGVNGKDGISTGWITQSKGIVISAVAESDPSYLA